MRRALLDGAGNRPSPASMRRALLDGAGNRPSPAFGAAALVLAGDRYWPAD